MPCIKYDRIISNSLKVHFMTKKIIPLGDRVLVKPLRDSKTKTKSGIYLPEANEKERPEQGEVIAVGEGKMNDSGIRIPLEVKKGDTVFFSKYGPEEIKVDDNEYLLIKEDQILAIIK